MTIKTRIADIMGSRVSGTTTLPGGSTGQIERTNLEDGRTIVVKYGNDNCALEARMLRTLAASNCLPVPDILHAEKDLLILSCIDNDGQMTDQVQTDIAIGLAQLHSMSVPGFGFEEDTTIGALDQPNPQEKNWISFFGQHRLLHRCQAAYDKGCLAPSLIPRIESLVKNLPDLLPENSPASLLHGDLWTGNVLCCQGRLTGIIDPALYWGDAEIELAYLPLFGGFTDHFYQVYQQYRPITPGFFETRMTLYQLWPLLVHVELFAGSYNESVDSNLRQLGF